MHLLYLHLIKGNEHKELHNHCVGSAKLKVTPIISS